MVRISIPSIGHSPVSGTPIPKISKVAAVDQLSSFLARPGRTALLTGAGVSVDSGIRPYRGEDGRYMNPNYQSVFHPIFNSFIKSPRPILVGHTHPTLTLYISSVPSISK